MEWIKELFFLWQDKSEYKEDVTYHEIEEFMVGNLSKKQSRELEDLIASDTDAHMLEAFLGGFCMCRDLVFMSEKVPKNIDKIIRQIEKVS